MTSVKKMVKSHSFNFLAIITLFKFGSQLARLHIKFTSRTKILKKAFTVKFQKSAEIKKQY